MILFRLYQKRRRQQTSPSNEPVRSGAFIALARNSIRASFRNRVALFFTLGLAVLFMVIFGELFGGNSFKVTYGFVDNDNTTLSHKFANELRDISGVTVEVDSSSEERDRLKDNNIDLGVIIPKGFQAALQGGGPAVIHPVEGSVASATAAGATQLLSGVLNGFVSSETHHPQAVTIGAPEQESINNVTQIDYFLPAMIAYIILQSGINFVAIGLADLRARKVLRRYRATPVTPAQILGAQIVGGMLTVILQILILIALGIGVFRAHTYGSWLVAAVPMLLGVVAFVGIGFLLTSAARTSESARGLSSMVAFPMMFLSGVFFPVTALPNWLQTVVHILPLTWLTDALHQVMNNGAGLGDIAGDCLVLAGWAVVMIGLATWRFRWD